MCIRDSYKTIKKNESNDLVENEKILCSHCMRTSSNGIRCLGMCVADNDTLIKASTKRDVTLRFIKSIEEEQDHRKNNPALRDAASESLPRTFLEVARHRLPGATLDSRLREALEACAVDENPKKSEVTDEPKETVKIMDIPSSNSNASLVVSIDSGKNNNDVSL